MATVARIALNVFRESVRDKVLYNLVFFAVLLIAASFLLGQLTAGQEVKIIKDLGLAATALFGLFMAVFIGIGLVSKEVERRSIYSLLSKPMTRTEFLLGKYAGLVLTLLVNVTVMSASLLVVLAVMNWITPEASARAAEAPAVDPSLLKALALIFVELMIVTGVALLFSTFSSPLLSAALTLGTYITGHFNADLKNFDKVTDSVVAGWLGKGVYYLLPNLQPFDVKAQVVHGEPVTWGYLGLTAAYGFTYVALLLIVATFIFGRRDFK